MSGEERSTVRGIDEVLEPRRGEIKGAGSIEEVTVDAFFFIGTTPARSGVRGCGAHGVWFVFVAE